MKPTPAPTHSILIVLLTAALLFSFGCGDDDDNATGSNANNLYGNWTYASVSLNGVEGDLEEVLEWDSTTVGGILVLRSNHLFCQRTRCTGLGPVFRGRNIRARQQLGDCHVYQRKRYGHNAATGFQRHMVRHYNDPDPDGDRTGHGRSEL